MENSVQNTTKNNGNFNLIFANSILQKLWLKGLITDEEKVKIELKNKETIS